MRKRFLIDRLAFLINQLENVGGQCELSDDLTNAKIIVTSTDVFFAFKINASRQASNHYDAAFLERYKESLHYKVTTSKDLSAKLNSIHRYQNWLKPFEPNLHPYFVKDFHDYCDRLTLYSKIQNNEDLK